MVNNRLQILRFLMGTGTHKQIKTLENFEKMTMTENDAKKRILKKKWNFMYSVLNTASSAASSDFSV